MEIVSPLFSIDIALRGTDGGNRSSGSRSPTGPSALQDSVILTEAPTRGAPSGFIMIDGHRQDLRAGILRVGETKPMRSNSEMPADILSQMAERMGRKRPSIAWAVEREACHPDWRECERPSED